MQIPAIGHAQFLILGALLPGPLTLKDLHGRTGWTKNLSTLIDIASRLHRNGSIDKFDELLQNGETRRVYSITSSGRQAWTESADFYLTIIQRFQESKAINRGPVLSRKGVNPSETSQCPERPATREEFEKIRTHADPDFAPIYCVLWILNSAGHAVTAGELAELTISDADLRKGTLRICGDSVRLDQNCLEAIREAIGGRADGRLFLRKAAGGGWDHNELGRRFRRARNAAGLPKHVKLIGRKTSWTHRQQRNTRQGGNS